MCVFSYVWSFQFIWKEDGSLTIRSTIAETACKLYMALSSTEAELLSIRFLHCGIGNLALLLLSWSWLDDQHVQTWPVFHADVPTHQKWTFYVKSSYYRQTYIQMPPKILPRRRRRFTCGNYPPNTMTLAAYSNIQWPVVLTDVPPRWVLVYDTTHVNVSND